MLETEQIAGLIAGIAMLVIAVSTVPFMYKGYYEGGLHLTHMSCYSNTNDLIVFYLTHLVMFLLIIVTAALHSTQIFQISRDNNHIHGLSLVHGPIDPLLKHLLELSRQLCHSYCSPRPCDSSTTRSFCEGCGWVSRFLVDSGHQTG
jgi:hypothetical protein